MKLTDIEFKNAKGESSTLGKEAGNVLLVVNVASKCGLTPQYEGLEKMFEKYQAQGFKVIGFPANEFAGQEPGTNAEIQQFCTMNFGVKFPVMEKIVVKGEGQHALYKELTHAAPKAFRNDNSFEEKLRGYGVLSGGPSDIMWNFEKFLVDRKGNVVGRFSPEITAEDPALVKAVEGELAK